jgi:uncharacterized protein YdeI (YjbR/CyaY-like superfamily)
VRRSVDADSFSVRFSPRKDKSIWSAVNVKRASALAAAGRMHPSGQAAFARKAAPGARSPYSYENRPQDLPLAYLRKLRAQPRALAFYSAQPPGYRRTAAFWVMSAKQEATRLRRLEVVIESSLQERTIAQMEKASKSPRRRPSR